MAIITPSNVPFLADQNTFVWAAMANGDVGLPAQFMATGDRTVQVAGTFGVGGTILFEGSLDGTNYFTLTDAGGTTISRTAAGLKAVLESPLFIRPRVSAGDGTTSLTAILTVRRHTNG